MPIKEADVVWDEPPAQGIKPETVQWDQPERDSSLAQWAGVAGRALAPYATAATLGGAAAAPTGVGIPFGAAGGVAALGLSDLATLGYNAAAGLFGGKQAELPSQAIQNIYVKSGLGRRPVTPSQQVASDILEGAAAGGLTAKSFSGLAPRYSGTTSRVLNEMAKQPLAQTLAGAGGAALPSAAANYANVQDPFALAALGYAGGILGGKAAVKSPPELTKEQLDAQATAAYTAAKNAGMVYPNQNFSSFSANLGSELKRLGFNRSLHPKVAAVLRQFGQEAKQGGDFGLDDLDVLRRVAKNAAGSFDRDERRLGRTIIEKLDSFIMDPANVSAGKAPEGAFALKQARELWKRKSHVEAFDDAVSAAKARSETGENPVAFGQALREEFGKIARNPNRMKGFSQEEQGYIREIAKGSPSNRALRFVSRWLTPTSIRGVAAEAGIAASMLPFLGPSGLAAAFGTSLIGAGSKMRANAMSAKQAATARNAFVTGKAPVPRRNYVMLPSTAQAARAPERGEEAQAQREMFNIPWWAQAR